MYYGLLHLWRLWTVKFLPYQDPKVSEGQQRPKHVTRVALQRAADQQRIVQDRIVEDGNYLHVLCKRNVKNVIEFRFV